MIVRMLSDPCPHTCKTMTQMGAQGGGVPQAHGFARAAAAALVAAWSAFQLALICVQQPTEIRSARGVLSVADSPPPSLRFCRASNEDSRAAAARLPTSASAGAQRIHIFFTGGGPFESRRTQASHKIIFLILIARTRAGQRPRGCSLGCMWRPTPRMPLFR